MNGQRPGSAVHGNQGLSQRGYKKRLQAMLAVDDLVGNVVKTRHATGQLDNTYLVFSFDNGFHLGQHRLPSGKQTAYETDINGFPVPHSNINLAKCSLVVSQD